MSNTKIYGAVRPIILVTLLCFPLSGCSTHLTAATDMENEYGVEAAAEKSNISEAVLQSNDGQEAEHEHSMTSEVIRDASCSTAGKMRYYCTRENCNYEYTENIAKLDHTPGDWSSLYAVDTGYYEGQVCTVCGETVNIRFVENADIVSTSRLDTFSDSQEQKENEVELDESTTDSSDEDEHGTDEADENTAAAHVHSYGEGEITIEPACEKEGEKTFRCTGCGDFYTEPVPEIGHDEGEWKTVQEATYTNTGLKELRCSACGKLLDTEEISVLPHEHQYELIGSEAAACENDGYNTYACAVCGDTYTDPIPASGHSYEWKTTKEATCTENGVESYMCAICNDVTETRDTVPTGHQASDWITDAEAGCDYDGSRHKECTVCDETISTESIPSSGHSWGEVIVTKEATEDEEGQGYKECSKCGKTEDVVIEKAEPHDHNYQETDSKDPTCTEEGYTEYTCNICGTSYKESILKLSHELGDWEIETEATEDAPGRKIQKCKSCGETINTEMIPQLEHKHNYEETDRKEATCTDDGYIEYTCGKCGSSYQVPLSAIGHDYELTEQKEATCTDDGYVTYICKNDSSHTKTDLIPSTEHDYVETGRKEATCTEAGYVEYTCRNCTNTRREAMEKKEHDYKCVNSAAATCTKDGYDTYRCANCEDEYSVTTDKAAGHSYTWVETTAPRLGVDGVESYKCSACGLVNDTRATEMLMTDGTDHVYYVCTGFENGEPVMEMVIGHFEDAAAAKIAEKVNFLRSTVGANSLKVVTSGSMQDFAKVRNLEIAWQFETTGGFNHIRPTDSTAVSSAWKLGENIAMRGYGSLGNPWTADEIADSFYAQWYNSSSHYANMVNTGYKNISVSVFALKTGSMYTYYGVQNFSLTSDYTGYTGDSWDCLIDNY